MNPDEQLNLQAPQSISQRFSKRNILIGIGVFVLIIVWLIISFGGGGGSSPNSALVSKTGQNGNIIVNTNNASNVITVTTTLPTGASETIKSGVSTQLAAGSYTITVKGPNGTQSAAATITAGKTSTYTINPSSSSTAELEPVADVNALSFGVSAGAIYYVDQDQLGDTLDQIDGHNNPSELTTANITMARWSGDGTYGVAQDASGNLYTVNNGTVSPLRTPGSTAGGQLVYTVAPNHNIYLAIGTKIWMFSAAGWQLVYTSSCAPNSMTAAPSGTVALLCGASDGPGGSGQTGSVVLLSAAGSHISKNIDADSAAWSPDSSHLAIFSSTGSAVYDTSLNSVATIPNSIGEFPVTPVWSSNSAVLFNLNDSLWEFSIASSSNQDQLLVKTSGGQVITNLVMPPNGAYVYVTRQADQGSTQDLQIWRLALKGQPFNVDMRVLGNTFPILQGRCLLYLVNFIGTPAIQSFGGQPQDDCQSVGFSEVQSVNVDPNSLQYQISNLPPDESPIN
jgi:hypothetical protein